MITTTGAFLIENGYLPRDRSIENIFTILTYQIALPTLILFLFIFHLASLRKYLGIELVSTAALTGLFYEVEGEPSSATDTKLLMDQVVLASMLFTVCGVLLYAYPEKFASPAVINAVTWAIYLLLLPTAASVLFGSYILNYLKGDSDSNSLLYGGIFDLAALFGFVTRFLVQLIRYILIYTKMVLYVVYVEYVFLGSRLPESLTMVEEQPRSIITIISDDIHAVISGFFHTIFDVLNVIIVHYTQLGALTLVLC